LSSPHCWFSFIVTVPLIIGIPAICLSIYYRKCIDFPNLRWIPVVVLICFAASLCLFCFIRFSNPGIMQVPTDQAWRETHPRSHFASLSRSSAVPSVYQENGSERYSYVAGHGVYVANFDHFCPWVGNLVGGQNMIWFTSFVSVACGSLFFVGGLCLFMFSKCA
jgi:hypothetical protein